MLSKKNELISKDAPASGPDLKRSATIRSILVSDISRQQQASMINFTLQDFSGSILAFLLFSLIFVAPGYVIGWSFDLFDFKKRLFATRFIVAIIISIAVSPILTFLAWNLLSVKVTFLLIAAFAIAFITILAKTRWPLTSKETKRLQFLALFTAIGWTIFIILSLIDIQWGNKLYYNVISFDLTSRTAIINAMTRSGVPPVNPSYFPGHSVRLTYLYYFWYIPCSLIAQIGSPIVDGRTAMIASVAWCGLGVMASIALYLRLRNPENGTKAWKSALTGNSLLLISGLDFIPALLWIISSRLTKGSSFLQGDIEHWNEQITAWVGAISWVPHHVAATIACLAGMMLLLSVRNKSFSRRIQAMFVAGLAFASAFGLSVYVTLVFVIFWGIWMIVLFIQREYQLSVLMAFAGIVAVIAVSPFIAGLIEGGSGSASNIPVAFDVRSFYPIIPFLPKLHPILLSLIFLAILPLNYLMELGFFFLVGLLWIQQHNKGSWKKHPFYVAEVILLSTVILVGSFFRSTTIGNNDLGWRAWLFGQFVLLIWGVDILSKFFLNNQQNNSQSTEIDKTKRYLTIFLVLGLITTITDVVLLRTWPILVDANIAGFPNSLSPDTKLGERTFAARQAYDYINSNLPEQIHVQHNPSELLNRPVGLYLNRPMTIAGQTAYGVPLKELETRIADTAKIFETDSSWNEIDLSCKQFFIDALVVTNQDPLWEYLPQLEQQRSPLYQNKYYAVFTCGNFSRGAIQP